jgi:hypothetical protein
MKTVILLFLVAASSSAFAGNASKAVNDKVCAQFEDQAADECAHQMCDEGIENGDWKDLDDCTSASDYAEAAQGACEENDTVEQLVKEYNKKHPTQKVRCEE